MVNPSGWVGGPAERDCLDNRVRQGAPGKSIESHASQFIVVGQKTSTLRLWTQPALSQAQIFLGSGHF